MAGKESLRMPDEKKATLNKMRPRGGTTPAAWIPLTDCIDVEGLQAPFAIVEKIIGMVHKLSNGRFRHKKNPAYTGSFNHSSDLDEVSEKSGFHSWDIMEKGEESDDEKIEPMILSPLHTPPLTATSTGEKSFLRLNLEHSGPAVHKFSLSLRLKRDVCEDEPSGLWWLRVERSPPSACLQGAKLNMFGDRSVVGFAAQESFVQLQQLLLEARNEVSNRLMKERVPSHRPVISNGPLLPITARSNN